MNNLLAAILDAHGGPDRRPVLGMLMGGYGEFEYDNASDTFRPGTLADQPPQAKDAKCGFACHTIVKNQDYVFTAYRKR